MATAPKANPKVVPIDEAAAHAAPPKKSNKKLFLILAGLLLILGAGGATWYVMNGKAESGEHNAKAEQPKPPVFVVMEPFTVNLQHESGDQYLQVAFTLQVGDPEQVDLIKLYMPLVRSRILLLLSSKKGSELATEEGKKKLQDEIIAKVKQPFTSQSPPLLVTGVFFTAFVIQ